MLEEPCNVTTPHGQHEYMSAPGLPMKYCMGIYLTDKCIDCGAEWTHGVREKCTRCGGKLK